MTIAMLEKPLDLASCFETQRVGVRGIEGRAVVDVLVEEKHGLAFLPHRERFAWNTTFAKIKFRILESFCARFAHTRGELLDQLGSLEPKVANDTARSAAIEKAPYWRHTWQRIGCFLNPSQPAGLRSCRPTTTTFARAALRKS
ncbi:MULTISPECIES: hypothetical protein [unclassified Bradyrhizobium]|uniref:hypothetical protein n=1 Tax=unclassified Bradyrhizobium TaxID=2631580 RepID=UPI00339B559F